MPYTVADHVSAVKHSAMAPWQSAPPWQLTSQSMAIVRQLLATLDAADYAVDAARQIAVARSATVELGATLKGPLIVGPRALVAANAYLRGGCWLDADTVVGPGCEVKSSFVFAGARLAHFNFVGDSVVGGDVNFEAGAVVCNTHNDRDDKTVWVHDPASLAFSTGLDKFGAYVGEGCRIGANAVLCPGTVLPPRCVVPRGAVVDPSVVVREAGA
jgi:UDP-N-acetylglucosamine diphosphorylase / glucose-1-phosphate thymidylyltransferase / UDP-N-acetylgalactosamine diphosphorylase / glucosamine-1-phosphate N-acetyltransferase / galactosamine-1-phosphate N-acetyltransferase